MAIEDWAPTVQDVAARIRARTKDANGAEIGTFTADTRPTRDDVERLIQQTVADLYSVIDCNGTLQSEFFGRATAVAAVETAAAVELSYYPEQVALGRSPYQQLIDLSANMLARLKAGIALCNQTDPALDGGALAPWVSVGHGLDTTPPNIPVREGALGWHNQW